MEFWRRKKAKGKARKCFLRNGSTFLEKLIADCNGISNPIRMFSSDQISKATNHFDPNCSLPELASEYSYWGFTFYKGVIDSRCYAMKKFTESWSEKEEEEEEEEEDEEEERVYNDIVLSARVSSHIGFLKLIGCCLEFPLPVLVFEDLEYIPLNKLGSLGSKDAPALPWNVRLKIAKEVATAVTYLHTAFPRIIIHRLIKATNILLDKNGRAKLTDFSIAVTLPEGKSWIEERVLGTMGYADPIYTATGFLTASSDVYSFGILMLVLLIGRPAVSDRSDEKFDFDTTILEHVRDLQERGEPVVFGGGSNDMRPGQMKMFLDLALRCCEKRNEDRPTMILVAKEIKQIERSLDC